MGVSYCEGAQVGHKAGSHQHVARNVVKHVLQVLHCLLPAHLLIRQTINELQRQPHGVNSGRLGRGQGVPPRHSPQAAGEDLQTATPGSNHHPDTSSPVCGRPYPPLKGVHTLSARLSLCSHCSHFSSNSSFLAMHSRYLACIVAMPSSTSCRRCFASSKIFCVTSRSSWASRRACCRERDQG